MANGLGVDFLRKKQAPKKRVVSASTTLPPQEDPLAMIKNIAGIVSQVKGGDTPPPGAPAGPAAGGIRVDLPAKPDIRARRRETISRAAGALLGTPPGTGLTGADLRKAAAATGRESLRERGPVVSPGFTGEEIAEIAKERFPERASIQPTAEEKAPARGVEALARQTAPSLTAQPVPPRPAPVSVSAEAAPAATAKAPAAKAAPDKKAAPAAKKGGLSFLEDPDFQRALLTAGTNILEQADPTGAFTQISRGALEGVKAFDVRKAGRAKAGKEAKKEGREEAEEVRKDARLALDERRTRAAELAAKSKKTSEDIDEERRIKAELKAAEDVRKEGGTLAEQFDAAEQARQLVGFTGGKGVVAAEGVPAETPGFIKRIFGAEPRPATPPRVAFPRRTRTQEKVRQGAEQKAGQKQTFRDFL